MYYYTLVCNIPFVTSLKTNDRFASNFVLMFLWWTPTKLVKIEVLPLLKMELLVILCIFLPILRFLQNLKPSYSLKSVTTTVPPDTFIMKAKPNNHVKLLNQFYLILANGDRKIIMIFSKGRMIPLIFSKGRIHNEIN